MEGKGRNEERKGEIEKEKKKQQQQQQQYVVVAIAPGLSVQCNVMVVNPAKTFLLLDWLPNLLPSFLHSFTRSALIFPRKSSFLLHPCHHAARSF